MKKVCIFGIFDPNYSRNRILTRGLIKNGWSVTHCRIDPKIHKGPGKYIELYKEYRRLHEKDRELKFDLVIVGYPGQTVVWLAYLLFGNKIIFDAFLSLYDANVNDRKIYPAWSLGAVKDWILDFYSSLLAHKVLLDTNEHIQYFSDTFSLSKQRFLRVLVGADETVFYPRQMQEENSFFTLHFHGTFIPLQGISYIIEAANILKDQQIRFVILGSGQESEKIRRLADRYNLKNVVFKEKVPYEELPQYISSADACLGIFGESAKTGRVIPNKVNEYAAMAKPIITADTRAIREVYTDKENILLCKVADAEDLADTILELKNSPGPSRTLIGKAAYQVYKQTGVSDVIVRKLLNELQ